VALVKSGANPFVKFSVLVETFEGKVSRRPGLILWREYSLFGD
jgi:hypothetical protein